MTKNRKSGCNFDDFSFTLNIDKVGLQNQQEHTAAGVACCCTMCQPLIRRICQGGSPKRLSYICADMCGWD